MRICRKYVSEEQGEAIIISKFLSPENKDKIEFGNYMKQFIQKNSTAECKIEITGMPFIDVTMDRSLINSQLGSLAVALIFVIIIVSAILRSFSAGIYASIPIISAIIILFGLMGYTGIPLNVATVLVASIAMGIGIDYSIHVITHFNESLTKGGTCVPGIGKNNRDKRKSHCNQCYFCVCRFSYPAFFGNGAFTVFRIADFFEHGWIRIGRA